MLSHGVVSDYVEQSVSVVTEPLLAVSYGVLVGLVGLGLLRLGAFGDPMELLEQAARLTLGIAVFGVAPVWRAGEVSERADS
jgi:hypothetical protein